MPTKREVPIPEGLSPESFVQLDPDEVRDAIDKWFANTPDLSSNDSSGTP
jgi:hypothetical protein